MKAEPLEPDAAFPYLVRTVAYNNSDLSSLYHNLRKAWWRWGIVAKVMAKLLEMVWAHGLLYKAAVQTVWLYWSNIWVVTWAMLKVLEVFHNWSSRRISGEDGPAYDGWRVGMSLVGRHAKYRRALTHHMVSFHHKTQCHLQ